MMRWVFALALAVVVAAEAVPGVYESKEHGLTLVATPYGWRPKQCVHTWPSGTRIHDIKEEQRTEITLPTGKVINLPTLPECKKMDYKAPEVDRTTVKQRAGAGAPAISDGWLDNAAYYTDRGDKTEYMFSLNGTYTIPNTPKQNGGVIFYFLGSQNNDGSGNEGVTIVQPVLTYGNGGKYYWFMNSWNCCPNGQAHESSEIKGFGPGDEVFGDIRQKGSEGSDWLITSTYPTKNEKTTLEVADNGRTFDWVDATMEVYSIGTACAKLPTGVMEYTDIELVDQNSKGDVFPRSPIWGPWHNGVSGCNGNLTVWSSKHISIQHN